MSLQGGLLHNLSFQFSTTKEVPLQELIQKYYRWKNSQIKKKYSTTTVQEIC